ncbi:unnamed protein product [Cyclocybe aegerita]|uniref:Cytochrome P450 n=1 Tax=Cyclocybe aegerita TaxID=1973307 RepID=A0A8S0VRZ1_CYCAE|nr:unnamed protein product [Cyclocybe aegerita]
MASPRMRNRGTYDVSRWETAERAICLPHSRSNIPPASGCTHAPAPTSLVRIPKGTAVPSLWRNTAIPGHPQAYSRQHNPLVLLICSNPPQCSNPLPPSRLRPSSMRRRDTRDESLRKARTTVDAVVPLASRISPSILINTHNSDDASWFNKHILILLGKRRLTEMLPSLLDDVNVRMIGWGKKGCFDPFKNIYDLVFQMTVRMASCSELANDRATLDELQKLYWQLEKSSTPTALLPPWFPGPAKRRKRTATKELFTKTYDVVEARKKAAIPSSDAVDVLLGQGHSTTEVVEFIVNTIFAGVVNTGMISCWALVYLASHEEWMAKVKAEVNALIEKHTNTLSTESLAKRLATIPISAWEDEMPVMEAVIRETLRITLTNAFLRRNVIDELNVSNGTIQQGDFVAYNVADVHLNSEIYTNPYEFDPGRYDPGREEDKKTTFGFVGWGAGRHPCTGVKVAKLEIKVIVAIYMMLAGFDFDVVDKNGEHMTKIPVPDRNDIH